MQDVELDASQTAVVLIDLQRGIMGYPTAPHTTASVLGVAADLAGRFRGKGATIVYVRVDLANMIQLPVDQSHHDPNVPPPQPAASEIVPEAGRQPDDLLITKRHWDAFGGTELERVLRERGIRTIVLCGVATHIGVESTARSAASRGFEVVLVEDATTSISADAHQYSTTYVFPLLGRVRSAVQVHPI
jgi:nicotinamidase-related amidase